MQINIQKKYLKNIILLYINHLINLYKVFIN